MSNHFLEALDGVLKIKPIPTYSPLSQIGIAEDAHKVNYIKGEMQIDVFPVAAKDSDEFQNEIMQLPYPSEPPHSIERVPGKYFVKFKGDDEFQIALWYYRTDGEPAWAVFRDDSDYEDIDFAEIDPEQIVRKHPKY